MVETADVEPRIWGANCKIIRGFPTAQAVSAPNLHIVQESAVSSFVLLSINLNYLPDCNLNAKNFWSDSFI